MHVVIMPQIVSKVEICKTKLWIPKMCHVCVCCLEALAFIHVILLCLLSLFSHQGSLFIYHLLIPPLLLDHLCTVSSQPLEPFSFWVPCFFLSGVFGFFVFSPSTCCCSFVFVSLCKCVFSFRLFCFFFHILNLFFFSEKFKKVE